MIARNSNPAVTSVRRRGTVYVAVLGVALVVGVMAAVAMAIVRVERRIDVAHRDQQQAQTYAHAAVEFATNRIHNEANWHTAITPNAERPPTTFCDGTIAWVGVDLDGSFSDDLRDNLTIIGIGRAGEAVAAEQVTLMPTGDPLSCLEVALLSNGAIVLPSGSLADQTRIQSDQTIASNDDVDASASNVEIDADVEAGGTTSGGGNITGNDTGGAAVRQLPGDDAFSYYKAVGTWIDVADLTQVGAARELQGVVLSPASNPFGQTNPEGIYVIDGRGLEVNVICSRIVGTLVVLNAAATSGIKSVALFEPAVANYPVLMVDGDFELSVSDAGSESISEAAWAVNLNPPDTPYLGVANSTQSDTLTAGMNGLVYVSGNCYIRARTFVDGGLVTSAFNIDANADLQVDYKSAYFDNPPPGFASGNPMEVIPGSWKRVAY